MFLESKKALFTACGAIPFKTLKETGHIINKIKKDFGNKVKINKFDDYIYYEYEYEGYN